MSRAPSTRRAGRVTRAPAGSLASGPWIQGVYDLPVAILFQETALGSRTRVSMGTQPGDVILPRSDPTKAGEVGFNHPLLPPTSFRPRFASAAAEDPWGKVFAAGPRGAADGAAAVSRLMVRFLVRDRSCTTGNDVAERVVQALPNWFRNVAVWLQALTQQDLDPDNPTREMGGPGGLFMWGVDPENEAFIAMGRQVMTVTIESRSSYIGGPAWRLALRQASTAGGPPLAWEILVAASRAARRGNGRRAILEVGTAVEIAIEQAIRGRLEKSNALATVGAIMDQIRMLGPRIEFGRKLGLVLPSDIRGSLVEPRNSAAHGGSSPDSRVVQQALRMGREVLETHAPLR